MILFTFLESPRSLGKLWWPVRITCVAFQLADFWAPHQTQRIQISKGQHPEICIFEKLPRRYGSSGSLSARNYSRSFTSIIWLIFPTNRESLCLSLFGPWSSEMVGCWPKITLWASGGARIQTQVIAEWKRLCLSKTHCELWQHGRWIRSLSVPCPLPCYTHVEMLGKYNKKLLKENGKTQVP